MYFIAILKILGFLTIVNVLSMRVFDNYIKMKKKDVLFGCWGTVEKYCNPIM